MNLELRAKTKEGKWFYQKDQYLSSYLRRLYLFNDVSHPKYLPEDFKVQIKLFGFWFNIKL